MELSIGINTIPNSISLNRVHTMIDVVKKAENQYFPPFIKHSLSIQNTVQSIISRHTQPDPMIQHAFISRIKTGLREKTLQNGFVCLSHHTVSWWVVGKMPGKLTSRRVLFHEMPSGHGDVVCVQVREPIL